MTQTLTNREKTKDTPTERKDCLIVTGGEIDREFAREVIRDRAYTYIIGADRGVAFLYDEGICPTHIVGDFDSLPPEIFEKYQIPEEEKKEEKKKAKKEEVKA